MLGMSVRMDGGMGWLGLTLAGGRAARLTAFGVLLLLAATAQTAMAQDSGAASGAARKGTAGGKSTAKTAWRKECVSSGEFCLQAPASWKHGVAILDGAGLQVNETADEMSAHLSSGAIDVPAVAGKERPTAQELTELVLSSLTGGAESNVETLERSTATVGGMEASIVKVKIHDGTSERVEMVAVIDGEESTVYFVEVAAPFQDATRLEAVFEHALKSWQLAEPRS
jgi:hypothetical protein